MNCFIFYCVLIISTNYITYLIIYYFCFFYSIINYLINLYNFYCPLHLLCVLFICAVGHSWRVGCSLFSFFYFWSIMRDIIVLFFVSCGGFLSIHFKLYSCNLISYCFITDYLHYIEAIMQLYYYFLYFLWNSIFYF